MNPAASTHRAFHVWFSTKGRKPVLVEGIRAAVIDRVRLVAARTGSRLIAVEAIEDHVHLLETSERHYIATQADRPLRHD
jgi:REP element-mobilizing transposase RayT